MITEACFHAGGAYPGFAGKQQRCVEPYLSAG